MEWCRFVTYLPNDPHT